MRIFMIFSWAGLIFVLTCTASFSDFIQDGVIRFQWVTDPDLAELLSPLPAKLSRDFLLQKVGHLFAFFILTLFMLLKVPSSLFALFTSITYATLTELLQLYFTRDGRIFDIGFDIIGILLATAIGSLLKTQHPKHISRIQ